MTIHHDAAVVDATRKLSSELELQIRAVRCVEDRYFSSIYEVAASDHGGEEQLFILKISRTSRSCKTEFTTYNQLASMGLNTLTPVLYSEEFNYLVTRKRVLVDLPQVLTESREDERLQYLQALGVLIRDLEAKTGTKTHFDKAVYETYLAPRVEALQCIGNDEKRSLLRAVSDLAAQCDKQAMVASLATDVNLGNLHIDERNQLVLLDMGDVCTDHSYANIVTVYQSIRFGPLQPYVERPSRTQAWFGSFMSGYASAGLDDVPFCLYEIRALVRMLLFVEALPASTRAPVHRFLSALSDRWLLRRLLAALRSCASRCGQSGRATAPAP